MRTYIGIDNGTTGSIGIIQPYANRFLATPTIMQDSYTKPVLKKKTKAAKKRTPVQARISRVDHKAFHRTLVEVTETSSDILIIIERPMINPMRFKASMSAMRCLESQLVAIEDLNIPYRYIDSKEWQSEFISNDLKGTDSLKLESKLVGVSMWPQYIDLFIKQGDADSMLIAEYAKRQGW